jgi:cytochrome c oxidase assembly protein subunit 15
VAIGASSRTPAAGRSVRARLADRILPATAQGFVPFTLGVAVVMYANVVSGASVRLTGSGLGCPDWPLCHGAPVPPAAYHSVVEYSNRVVAFAGLVAGVLVYLAARRHGDRTSRILAGATAVGVLAQAPLGAITVRFKLSPLVVMSHFMLAIVVVGLATALWARVSDPRPAALPRSLTVLAGATALLGLGLVWSGTFSTAAGPHAGGAEVHRLGNLHDATWWHVRVATTFIVVLAVALLALWRRDVRPTGLGPLTLALLVLLPVQAAIGEYQYRNGLPWGIVLVHVGVAGLVWMSVVTLALRSRGARPENAGRAVDPRPSRVTAGV